MSWPPRFRSSVCAIGSKRRRGWCCTQRQRECNPSSSHRLICRDEEKYSTVTRHTVRCTSVRPGRQDHNGARVPLDSSKYEVVLNRRREGGDGSPYPLTCEWILRFSTQTYLRLQGTNGLSINDGRSSIPQNLPSRANSITITSIGSLYIKTI